MQEHLLYALIQDLWGNNLIKGRVLNVGLGDGGSARVLLSKKAVDEVYSVEIASTVVMEYMTKHDGDPLEDDHITLVGDIEAVEFTGPPFDVIYLDILESQDEAQYDKLLRFVVKAEDPETGILAPGGIVIVNWTGDTPVERQYRAKVETILKPVPGRSPLASIIRARGRADKTLHYERN